MTSTRREKLIAQTDELAIAKPEDFAEGVQPAQDVPPNQYRVIANTQLRAKLLIARLAEGIQSPKGPQKIASIIRLYPEGNAPEPATRASRASNQPRTSRGSRRVKQPLPSVEDLRALLTRIDAVEGHVAREMSMTIDGEAEALQKRAASVSLDVLPGVLSELNMAMAKRADVRAFARPEAFKQIAADREFAQRVFLPLIST